MHASFPFGAGTGHLVLSKPAATGVEKEEYILEKFHLKRIERDQKRWSGDEGAAFLLDGKMETLKAIENLKEKFVALDCMPCLSPLSNHRRH